MAGRRGRATRRSAWRADTSQPRRLCGAQAICEWCTDLTAQGAPPDHHRIYAMAELYQTLQITKPQPDTLLVTLNRPEVANAMNTQMGLDLLDLFHAIGGAPNEQRCIVLTGAGGRAFCAGGYLKERNGMTDRQWQDQHLIFERAIRAIIHCPVPVIA